MKKKYVFILILILIIIFIILNFYKSNKNIFKDIMIFNLWEDTGNRKEYVINPENPEQLQIDIFQTINNNQKIQKKIAPGSYGQFIIKLTRPINQNSKVIIEEEVQKPQNLIFILNGEKTDSIKQMQKKINKQLQKKNKIIINWEWEFDNSQEKDIQDTEDGKNAINYYFKIQIIEEGNYEI